MDADTISKMTRQQRLQAMESLWDALVHETAEPVSMIGLRNVTPLDNAFCLKTMRRHGEGFQRRKMIANAACQTVRSS
jgi:hypothetical protein